MLPQKAVIPSPKGPHLKRAVILSAAKDPRIRRCLCSYLHCTNAPSQFRTKWKSEIPQNHDALSDRIARAAIVAGPLEDPIQNPTL
ncbi:hypothetical protein HDF13_002824 [Edaphobacter lichenicola]|nr:hypothetical protein [Edaphobacter lichenicola]